MESYQELQSGIDKATTEKESNEQRIKQLIGYLPPSNAEIRALEDRIASNEKTLNRLKVEQDTAERAFSEIFVRFEESVIGRADLVREKFASRISDFLLEDADISFTTTREAIGESGKRYDWPTFVLNMTSGTFDNPRLRRNRNEVSLSQGEFIDLAFRLALVEVAAEDGPATLVFDAPEASLDALFMRRAGAFLAKFTMSNDKNRLIVTSNLTNAEMIPALFGAYEPHEGDPHPIVTPRQTRRQRVINLLELAAPTRAVEAIGHRYDDLLDMALFPPGGESQPGL